MRALQDTVDAAAERTGFSGVVRLDRAGETELSAAYGFADRAHEIRNTVQTQFATASGAKGLTALTVMSLIERGAFELGTTARSLLGGDLPLIADGVTIEQLLAHRSGIGDYLDEDTLDDIGDYVLPVPVHELTATEQFLPILDGHETTYAAGERFAYNNGGYVVLALLAERATGVDFHELARTLVCQPAGMADTAFLRTDELPGRAALGYLSVAGLRTNMFHLPVVGNGDGGIYSTAADFNSFWDALFAGRIVSAERVAEMVRPRSDWPEESKRYGLGFHLHPTGDAVWWRDTTQACRSPACTSRRPRSPTPSSRTGQKVPGRSSSCSTISSAPEALTPNDVRAGLKRDLLGRADERATTCATSPAGGRMTP